MRWKKWKVKALAGQDRLNEAIDACHRWLEIQPDNRRGMWALTELEIQRDGLEPVNIQDQNGKEAKHCDQRYSHL